jgi:molecular chaperone HtpG
VKDVVKKYSDFVTFPIFVNDELTNHSKALWATAKSQVSDEQYTELYRTLTGHDEETPLIHIHLSVDAPVQFHALLYVPGHAPTDLFHKERRGLRLYAKRVLIMEDCEKLLPVYLRFLRGVVDSEDLSLNVSREMLQEDRSLGQIEQQLTKQSAALAEGARRESPEKYEQFWREMGRVFKEGLSVDWKNKDAIAEPSVASRR